MPSSPPVAGLPTRRRGGVDTVPVPEPTPVRHPWRAASGGLVTAAAVYAVIAGGLLPAPLVLALGVGLLVAVPSAPDLARRVAVNGSVFLGWVCTTWWVRWPVPVDHGALVLALAGAGLVVAVLGSPRPWERVSSLRPHVAAVDLLLPTGAALALAAMWRWAFPGSAHGALVALLPGADDVAHFHMFSTLRAYGATTRASGVAPDGSRWAYDSYPQGFHAVAATLSELFHPALPVGPPALVAYTQAVAGVVVLGTLVLTAAAVSVTGVRRRPLVALPAVVCTWAAFLWSPGQDVLADGFANFWLAAAAAGTALVLSLSPTRRLALCDFLAVGGLLVLVAHAWAPLIVIAAPAVLGLLAPVGATVRDPALRRRLTSATAVLGVAGLGVAKAVTVLVSSVAVGTLVSAFGGIHGTNPVPGLLLLVVGTCVCCTAPPLLRGRPTDVVATAVRARCLLLAPALGLALGSALLGRQLQTLGTSSYYFIKYFMGFELALAAFVPAVTAFVVASLTTPARRAGRVATGLVAVALATQAFGVLPRLPVPLFDTAREGTASVRPPFSAARMARGILGAAAASPGRTAFERDYLAIGPQGAVQAFYPDAWFHGIRASLSSRVEARENVLRRHVDTVQQAVPLARRMLRQDAELRLLVPAGDAAAVRAGLERALARRVVSVEPEGER